MESEEEEEDNFDNINLSQMKRRRGARLFLWDLFNTHKTRWKRFILGSKIYGWRLCLRQRKRKGRS